MGSLVQKIVEISVLAGVEIMKVYEGDGDWEVQSKSDDSPLTSADQKANELIVKHLETLDEKYPIISEENKLQDFSERKGFKRFWLVDPLDGGRPIMGVVYVPVTGDLYYAEKGAGAYHKNGEGPPQQMNANTYTSEDKGLRVVCSRSHINEATQSYIDNLSEPDIVSKGSSLKFMLLASGQAEVYPRMGPTMEWDTGAAQIILEEAGGKILHNDTGLPLSYNKENLLNPYFIATAAEQV